MKKTGYVPVGDRGTPATLSVKDEQEKMAKEIPPRARFLRHLVAAKGWQLGEFIRAMEETRVIQKDTLPQPTVRRWYSEGPPKGGPNHRAMLRALGIADKSEEQAMLQGRQPWKPKGRSDLLGWLRQAEPSTDNVSLRVLEQRGIRPVPNVDPDLPRLHEGYLVQVVLGLAAPCFVLVFNHSHGDGTLWLLSSPGLAAAMPLVPEAGVACLPIPTPGAFSPPAYPVGGPEGRNDIYAVLMRSPLPDPLGFADAAERPLFNQELETLGESLLNHEDAVTEVRRFAYLVE
jgi:hypothetical protein